MVYLFVLNVVLIPLIVQTDSDHRNSEIYQAMQIGVLQLKGPLDKSHIVKAQSWSWVQKVMIYKMGELIIRGAFWWNGLESWKNSRVKRARLREILGWVTSWEVLHSTYGTKP